MGSSTNAYGTQYSPAEQALPIIGNVVGNILAPGWGGYAGRGIGQGVANEFAVGDAAGAPAGTQASAETNMGGIFQGAGLSGFWNNFLEPQLLGGPSAGEGGGSIGGLQGIVGAQQGAGDYPYYGPYASSAPAGGNMGSAPSGGNIGGFPVGGGGYSYSPNVPQGVPASIPLQGYLSGGSPAQQQATALGQYGLYNPQGFADLNMGEGLGLLNLGGGSLGQGGASAGAGSGGLGSMGGLGNLMSSGQLGNLLNMFGGSNKSSANAIGNIAGTNAEGPGVGAATSQYIADTQSGATDLSNLDALFSASGAGG